MLNTSLQLHSCRAIISELCNGDFIKIIKAANSDNIEFHLDSIYELIDSYVQYEENALNALDYACILLHWRSIYISPNITVQTENDKGDSIKISNSVRNVIDNIINCNIEDYIIEISNKMQLLISYPLNISDDKMNNAVDMCSQLIGAIKLDNDIITDKDAIGSIIQYDILLNTNYSDHIDEIFDGLKTNSINIINHKYHQSIASPVTILRIAIMLFKMDMEGIMSQQFNFINKFGSTYDHYISATPNEVKDLIDLTRKDIEAQNKAQSGGKSPNMPSIKKPRV